MVLRDMGLAELVGPAEAKAAATAAERAHQPPAEDQQASRVCAGGTVSRLVWLTVFFLGMLGVMVYKFTVYCCHGVFAS